MFCTSEVLHISDVYNENQLNTLIEEKGLHIGHTYLLNELPYINGIIKKENKDFKLSKEWSRFIKHLQKSVISGNLWNPTISKLGSWVRMMQFVSIIPINSNSLKLFNEYYKDIPNFTLLLPMNITGKKISWNGRKPKGSKIIDRNFVIFDDLGGNSESIISWE